MKPESASGPGYINKPSGYYSTARNDLIGMIPEGARRLLDVGCAEGVFGAAFRQSRHNAEVWGIELMPEAASVAAGRLDRVIQGTIESALDQLPDASFDCIAFNDVLEHLSDPWAVLRAVQPKLAHGGHVLASIPNLRYFDVVRSLVFDADFRYADQGVLDNTHLRFFTLASMKRMFDECGLETLQATGLRWKRFPTWFAVVDRLSGGRFEDMHYLQFALLARPMHQGG